MGIFLQQFRAGSVLLKPRSVSSAGSTSVRYIHRWVRPTIQIMQARRRAEQEKYPKPPTPRSSFIDWNSKAEMFAFGARLGEKFEESILRRALTDKSYIVEATKQQEILKFESSSTDLMEDNEMLAKEGIQIIQKVLIKFLRQEFPKFPTQGIESVCNYLTSNEVLSHVSSHIGTTNLILCNEHPPSDEILSRAFKAIVSALQNSYVDSDINKTRTELFILDFVATQLCGKDINGLWDIPQPWKMLMEIRKQRNEGPLEPRLIRDTGRNTILSAFVIGLFDSQRRLTGTGIGETLDIAQEMAARDALKRIFETREPKENWRLCGPF